MPSYVLPVCVCEAFASPHVHLPTLRDAYGPSIYTLEDPVKLALKPMAPAASALTTPAKAALAEAKELVAHAAAAIAKVKTNTCNRHDDCAKADAEAKQRAKDQQLPVDHYAYYGADHCHDSTCEDCFGS
jgi:hypothetical protein